MKALLIHEDSIIKRVSGAARYTEYFLNQKNLDVDILHKGPATRIGKNNFYSFILNMPNIKGLNETLIPLIRYYRTKKNIKDKVKLLEIAYDVIHSNTNLIVDYLNISEKPVVLTAHGIAATEYKYNTTLSKLKGDYYSLQAEKNIFTKKIGKLAKIIAISNLVKNELQTIYNVPGDKISVIYNGIDTQLYKPTTNTPTNDYFLYVGRLDQRKGFYELLDVMKKLKNQKFIIISNVLKYGSLSSYSKILIDLSKKQHNIIIKSNVADEDLKLYYSNAKATILPSCYEPLGYVVLESMACGTPCIVSSNSGATEVIGEYGSIFKAGSLISLKNAVESFSYPNTWRREVRKQVEDKFSSEIFINDILKLYEEIIEDYTKTC